MALTYRLRRAFPRLSCRDAYQYASSHSSFSSLEPLDTKKNAQKIGLSTRAIDFAHIYPDPRPTCTAGLKTCRFNGAISDLSASILALCQ
jgi:hypothetical protein